MAIGLARRASPQTRRQSAVIKSVMAPTGGVNARDALAHMPETDAIVLDNWFPTPSCVAVRNGSQAWATGMTNPVETVAAYNGFTTRKLFSWAGGKIYDTTAAGAVGAALITGLTNSRWQTAMFNAGGGNVLVAVNGADAPLWYNGTTWATTTISGTSLTASNLITVTVFKQRCWYIENNTMNVWYSAVTAFQGALTVLPLGAIFKMGGYLMQMATWTIDNVSGINDYAAFITSEGEVAVYQGYDPSSISTWSLVGVFRVGRPIGRRCITKFGSDVLVICTDGLAPLSKELLTDRTQPDALLTNKIINAINNDAASYGSNFGWQCIEHPLGNKLILNVPEVTNTTSHQWVMNTVSTSNAWCRFRNWNANCWEVQQDSLYYGGNGGTLYLADVGTTDAGGAAILVDAKPAFSYFDSMTQKRFLMARPNFVSSAVIGVLPITLNVDFNDVSNVTPFFNTGTTAQWNVSNWDTGPWTSVLSQNNWLGVSGIGYAACGRLTFQIYGVSVQWQSIDYMFEPGGPL
jgi:hypothetical protein